MNPQEFENWVKSLNELSEGNQSVPDQINSMMATENIVEHLLELISSNSLTINSIIFALSMINSKDIYTEAERNALHSFFDNYFIDNRKQLCNQAFISVLSKLFLKTFKFQLNEIPQFIQNLENIDESGLILAMSLCSNMISSTKTVSGFEYAFEIAMRPIFSNSISSVELLHSIFDLMFNYLNCCRSGKSISVPNMIIEQIYSIGGANTLFDVLEKSSGEVPILILKILSILLQSPISSFGKDQSFRDNFVADVTMRIIAIFNEKRAEIDYIPYYVEVCKRIKFLLPDLNPRFDDLGEAFIKAYGNPTFYVLTPTILMNSPNLAEIVLSFFTEQTTKANGTVRMRNLFVQTKIIKKSCQQIENTIFNIDFSSEVLEVFVSDPSSNLQNVILDLHKLNIETIQVPVNDSDSPQQTKTIQVDKVRYTFDLANNLLLTAIQRQDPIKTAFYLSYITKCLDYFKDPVLFTESLCKVHELLLNLPPLSPENINPGILSLELSILEFFQLVFKVLLSDTDPDRLIYLRDNSHIILDFLRRFLSEVQGEQVISELAGPIMDLLDFSKYKQQPLQIIAMDDTFFELLINIDFFLNYESAKRKTRDFFSYLFTLGYSMPDPTRISTMLDIIARMFSQDRTNAIIYYMLAGAVSSPKCKFEFLIDIIKDHYFAPFKEIITNKETPDLTLFALIKFLVSFSDATRKAALPCLGEYSIFCFTFLTNLLRLLLDRINSMENSVPLFKIIAYMMQVLSNIIDSPHINIGVLEIYKRTDFRDIITVILERMMLIPLDAISCAPKLALRYMNLLSLMLQEVPTIFFEQQSEIQHHQIEATKVILSIDAEEAITSALNVIANYLTAVAEFRNSDEVPDDLRVDLFKFCLSALIIKRQKLESLAKVILIFARSNPELVNNTVNDLFGQVPEEYRNDAIIPFKHLRSYLRMTVDYSRTPQIPHILAACLDIGEFFEQFNIPLTI